MSKVTSAQYEAAIAAGFLIEYEDGDEEAYINYRGALSELPQLLVSVLPSLNFAQGDARNPHYEPIHEDGVLLRPRDVAFWIARAPFIGGYVIVDDLHVPARRLVARGLTLKGANLLRSDEAAGYYEAVRRAGATINSYRKLDRHVDPSPILGRALPEVEQ